MGWNEPDKGKDPWSGKNQPPDLDEALKRLQEKLKKTFWGGSQKDSGGNGGDNARGGGILAVMILLVAFILWALSGIFIIGPAEQAVILRFGKYVETVGPGPHWIPRLISSKVVMNVDRVSDYSYSAQMLTKDENLVSVAVVVQYHIGDLEDYLFKVADPQESLQQATSSALRQVIGQTTLDEIITEGREVWGSKVQQNLVEILDSYQTGIKIVNVSPQPARAPENVQDAFDDAIKAQEDEKRFKEQARAYEARVIPIAEGNARRIIEEAKAYAEQTVLRAKGETAEFLKLLPEFIHSPFVTGERMYLDAMEQVLSSSSKIIVDGKAGNMLYLPLEKLLAVSPPLQADKQAMVLSGSIAKTPETEILYEGRPIVRPTERLGRND
ncbi:FtsH protease activity modulator HflK [Legionella londiniensis]|uniref:Protein HflK n=1 Tax=Legionella londiniensis TaxID=45068 RepID=A0A0W0VSZ9_9GAMM|nr:FtsH protease activity modulator HflK [Legionella londiniensis]KTD23183.1 protease subunit HflK [Legionella londiniensis]STX93806.1 protease subunit HflK [Legionella londiniensis]